LQEFYYTPQGAQLLSSRFADVPQSSDCIFKSELPSSQKKNSERTVKQIYSSNDPNRQDAVATEGVRSAQNAGSHIKRKPLQGFLPQHAVIQQEKIKVRSS
jgi:hypothetical protein